MVQSELVHSGKVETTVGFELFPVEEVKAEPKQKAKPVKAGKAKRGPGRPRVYDGTDRRIIAAALKKHGLTKGIEWLAAERNLKISLTLARAVASQFEITFSRGRPKAA